MNDKKPWTIIIDSVTTVLSLHESVCSFVDRKDYGAKQYPKIKKALDEKSNAFNGLRFYRLSSPKLLVCK